MPETNRHFDFEETATIASLIGAHSARGAPFSFIRLGDGEGALLAFGKEYPGLNFEYFSHHLGDEAPSLVPVIRDHLKVAIKNANLIGIRDDVAEANFSYELLELPEQEFLPEFKKHVTLRAAELTLPYADLYRIALLHVELSSFGFSQDQKFCSAWLNYKLFTSGYIIRLLATQDRIGIISCRDELPAIFSTKFDLTVDFYKIPGMYREIDPEAEKPNYRASMEQIMSQNLVKFPGMPFFVGGGFLGKIYCEHIRAQGGIALDLGSLMDFWAGKYTRPLVVKSMFPHEKKPHGIPLSLMLSDANIRRHLGTNPHS